VGVIIPLLHTLVGVIIPRLHTLVGVTIPLLSALGRVQILEIYNMKINIRAQHISAPNDNPT
jgi:hypothetical protein